MENDLFAQLDAYTANPTPETVRPIVDHTRIMLCGAPATLIDSHRHGAKLVALAFSLVNDKKLAATVGEGFLFDLCRAFMNNAKAANPLYDRYFYIGLADQLNKAGIAAYARNNPPHSDFGSRRTLKAA